MTSSHPGAHPGAVAGAGNGPENGPGTARADRVMLREATALILRSPHHLQFGTVPGHSLVLGVPPAVSASQVMLVLREAMRPVCPAELAARLGHCGLSGEHAEGIITDLQNADLLRRLPTTSTTVQVTGTATLAGAVLHNLSRYGIRASPVTPGAPAFGRLGPDSLVVLAGHLFPPQDVTHRLMVQAVPHLPCGVIDGGVVIGPLVLPGDTACLECIDTQLLARDPDWRHIRAQSAGGGTGSTPMTDLTASLTAGVLRTALGTGRWDGLRDRRILDPVTLETTRQRVSAVPGCRDCGTAGTAGARDRPGELSTRYG